MKINLNKMCAIALLTLCSLPAMAQLNGTGYYRFRNSARTSDYISIANDKFNYTTVISTAGGGLTGVASSAGQERAMTCATRYLQNDIHMINDTEVIDLSSIIYADKAYVDPSDNEYNLIGQGTSLLTLSSGTYPGFFTLIFKELYVTINRVSGSGSNSLYTASMPLKASNNSMADLGIRYFVDEGGQFDTDVSSVASQAKARWYIEPIDHFNVMPEVELNGKYFTTIKVPFAINLDGQVEKAYKITANNGGLLTFEEISGTIPAGTPVLLQCGSPNAADCPLIPTGAPVFTAPNESTTSGAPAATDVITPTGDNLLAGTYYCNTDGTITFSTKSGTSTFDGNHRQLASGKFVIGKNAEGKLGFIPAANAGLTYMPANKAWLTSAGVFRSVATPTISPSGDTYNEAQSVTITAEEGATILYSTDGGATWNEYNEAIPVGEGTTTIQAKAIKQGLYNDSEVISATYTVEIPAPELAMTPESMTISDAAAGVFTITGTNVNGNINANLANTSDWYLNPETLSNTGGEVNVTYTGRALTAQNTVNAYVANNPDVKASATVNYQTDIFIVTDNGVEGGWNFGNGAQMTNEDGIYTATFTATVPNTFILFARKLGDGVNWNTRYVFGPSSEGDWVMPANMAEFGGYIDTGDDDPIKLPYAGEYTIIINANNYSFNIIRKIETVATPTFTPAAGTYTGTQTVTIECETIGATILYKIGDSEYQTYIAPIEVTESCTITAKATKDGWNDSEEATAEYIIEIPVVHKPGDVNHDGTVNIKDVTDLIDYLLGSNNEVCEVCANVKDDGAINIADVTALIDLLLNNPAE